MTWNGKLFFGGVLMFLLFTVATGYGAKWAGVLSAPMPEGQ